MRASPESHRGIIRNVACVAVIGALAWNAWMSDGAPEEHSAEVTEQSVEILTGTAQTCVLTPNLRAEVALAVHWDSPDLDLPFGLPTIGPPDTVSEYTGNVAGDVDLCLKGVVAAVQRPVESASPTTAAAGELADPEPIDFSRYQAGPEEKVVLSVDRDELQLNRARVNFPAEDITYQVKDGYIVERQGQAVDPPELAFAADGTYKIGRSRQPGQDSAGADLYEAIALGRIDIGEDAIDTLNTAEQLAVANPACIDAITERVPLDDLIEASLVNALTAESGFVRENVHIEFMEGTRWPAAEQLRDENGQTFAQKEAAFQRNVPGGMELRFNTDCTAATVSPKL